MFTNRNLAILFLSLVVAMLGFGIIIPILPFYVERFGGSGLQMGMLMSIFSLMQLVFSPIWGSLSDRIGRKRVLGIGALGNALSMAMMGFAHEYWMLFAARALSGVLSSATMPAAMAFISDSTDEKSRGGGMGIVGAAFGLGMMLGPGIGGVLSKVTIEAPFFFAAVTSLVAMALIGWLLPELEYGADGHGGRRRRRGKRWRRRLHDPCRAGREQRIRSVDLGLMVRSLSSPIGFLLILAFLHNFALTNFEGIFGFYAQRRYHFDPPTIGLIMVMIGLVSTIGQGVLTGPLTRRFGDAAVIRAALFASALGFVSMLPVTSLGALMLTSGFFVLSNSLLRPSVASLTSKRTALPQGATMGLANAFMSLGRILGPLWGGRMLDIHLNYPFLSGAVVLTVAGIAALFYLPHQEETLAQTVSTD